MLKVLEINFHLEYIRTTNTADFKKFKNPSIPVMQSADNINAPPNLLPFFHGIDKIWKRIVDTIIFQILYNAIICNSKIKSA